MVCSYFVACTCLFTLCVLLCLVARLVGFCDFRSGAASLLCLLFKFCFESLVGFCCNLV